MEQYKYTNRLIINNDEVYLANSNDIDEVTFNTGDYAIMYRLENGIMSRVRDDEPLYEYDFENLYEEYTDWDAECGHEKIEAENEDGDICSYVKAEWENQEHYLHLKSEHGINISYYDITDANVIEGECFKSNCSINQDYPKTERQNFFKFVDNDGKEYYIKETVPFFADKCDYVFDLITKEEFEE